RGEAREVPLGQLESLLDRRQDEGEEHQGIEARAPGSPGEREDMAMRPHEAVVVIEAEGRRIREQAVPSYQVRPWNDPRPAAGCDRGLCQRPPASSSPCS